MTIDDAKKQCFGPTDGRMDGPTNRSDYSHVHDTKNMRILKMCSTMIIFIII